MDLYQKYSVAVPRYTSYPSVPLWDGKVTAESWKQSVTERFALSNKSMGVSLYLHLPFCESLCTFCGCNKIITKNHAVEAEYQNAIHTEWGLYQPLFTQRPSLKEVHLGGGTPTFFAPNALLSLLEPIFQHADIRSDADFGFEAHPNVTTREHLEALYSIGFRRVSFGVQDFDEKVQDAINRRQSFETVRKVTEEARRVGYGSVNFDLVYGLPFQNLKSLESTLDKVLELKPDRIAYYSYAHVPWLKPGQRRFSEADLPSGVEKRALYEYGAQRFLDAGYIDVGMDHFALPQDAMGKALRNKTLHRNFMGYTVGRTDLLLGLGVSAIGDSTSMFAQNAKQLDEYYASLEKRELPIVNGHGLSETDLYVRQLILNLMCFQETDYDESRMPSEVRSQVQASLDDLQRDGLVNRQGTGISVSPVGFPFLRNVCAAFDVYIYKNRASGPRFSSTI